MTSSLKFCRRVDLARVLNPMALRFNILVWAIAGCALGVHGQYPYFNQKHTVTGNAKVAGGITNSHIFTASMTPDRRHFQIARFDSVGQFEKDFLYNKDTIGDYDGCARCMEIHRGKVYTAANHFQNDNSPPYTLLFKLDEALNSVAHLDTLFAPPPYNQGIQVWGMTRDSDSSFLLTGEVVIETRPLPNINWRHDPFVARVDTNFNLLWFTAIPDPIVHRFLGLIGQDLEVDSYGGIMVTGSPPFWGLQLHAWAARLRQRDGQLLWRKEYTDGFGYSGLYVVDNGNGTYQYAMNKRISDLIITDLVQHGIMDTMGNRLSSHLIGNRSDLDGSPSPRENTIIDLVKTPDGHYYAAGMGYYGWFFGIGMKFTATGDSLWYREFSSAPFAPQGWPSKVAFLENFIQKDDGSLLHIGWTNDFGVAYPDLWLYGTDANGSGGIGLSDPEILPQLRAFPNPLQDRLYLSWKGNTHNDLSYQLQNLNGQNLLEGQYNTQTGIDVQNLPPGLYLLQLSQNQRPAAVVKLIKH